MNYQNTFNRYEIKYLITRKQHAAIKNAMSAYMKPDKFGKSDIRNIYFDTPDKLLIRRSLESPIYKEKLRVRSYGGAAADNPVFIELKKKYQSVVYKRRIAMQEAAAMGFLAGHRADNSPSQIADEISYFNKLYHALAPAVFISYEREAFSSKGEDELRITFDEKLLWRDYDLSLCSKNTYGSELLSKNQVLMEVKTAYALPLWLTAFLSENKIFKTSFSKYGIAYERILNKRAQGGVFSA